MSDAATACPKCGQPRVIARPAGRTEGSAIAALILGILGIVACPVVLSIPAVILGTQARRKIREDPTLEGEPMARAGLILGWIGIGLAGLAIVGAIVAAAVGVFSSGGIDVRNTF